MPEPQRFVPVGFVERQLNRLIGVLANRGLGPAYTYRLEVVGRKSGRRYSTPVMSRVRRDDLDGPALKAQGKPYEIGFTAAQYEGYVVNINNLITALRRHASSTRTAPARRSTTRPCRR